MKRNDVQNDTKNMKGKKNLSQKFIYKNDGSSLYVTLKKPSEENRQKITDMKILRLSFKKLKNN